MTAKQMSEYADESGNDEMPETCGLEWMIYGLGILMIVTAVVVAALMVMMVGRSGRHSQRYLRRWGRHLP